MICQFQKWKVIILQTPQSEVRTLRLYLFTYSGSSKGHELSWQINLRWTDKDTVALTGD